HRDQAWRHCQIEPWVEVFTHHGLDRLGQRELQGDRHFDRHWGAILRTGHEAPPRYSVHGRLVEAIRRVKRLRHDHVADGAVHIYDDLHDHNPLDPGVLRLHRVDGLRSNSGSRPKLTR